MKNKSTSFLARGKRVYSGTFSYFISIFDDSDARNGGKRKNPLPQIRL